MKRLYRHGKVWLNSQLQSLIKKCDHWIDRSEYISWPFGRAVAQAAARWLKSLFGLLRSFPRMTAYKATGSNWQVVFIGTEPDYIEIQQLFFPDEEIRWDEIGRVALWQLAHQTKIWQSEGVDLVICRVSRLLPLSNRTAFSFCVPIWVCQMVNLSEENLKTLLAGGKKRRRREQINAAPRKGFNYHFSRSLKDYEHFYHNMYVPNTKTRHGDRALVADYDGYLKESFDQGGLLLVNQCDRTVAGGVRYIANDTCYSVEHGILEADPELLKQGVNMLLDWYTIQWAADQGARRLNMGGSKPWSSNGVFNYKASWRSSVTTMYNTHEVWQIYADRLSPCLRDFINQIGFITEIKGDFYLVWIEPDGPGQPGDQMGSILDKASRQGLKGVVVLAPHSKHILTGQIEPDLQREET